MSKDELLNKFHNGTCSNAYNYFGCHKHNDGFCFRVWAPNALSISVVGSFNNWDDDANVMQKLDDGQTFFTCVTNAKVGDKYKYCITTSQGNKIFKCDPYAFLSDFPNSTA